MKNIASVPVKYAQGCIAVKEEYRSTLIYNTENKSIDALFCVDRAFNPCKICTFKGSILVPLGQLRSFNMDTFLRSKKGIYSRLDCVTFIVSLQGVVDMTNIRALRWAEIDMEVYTPFGVNGESLILANTRGSIPEDNIKAIKANIIHNLGASIITKEGFIGSRV